MAALLELHKQRGDLFRDDALKEILSFLNLNERFEKTRRHYLLRKRFLNPYLFPNVYYYYYYYLERYSIR